MDGAAFAVRSSSVTVGTVVEHGELQAPVLDRVEERIWSILWIADIPRSPRLERRDRPAAERMPARHCPSVGRIVDEFIMVERRVFSWTTTWCREAVLAWAEQ